MRAVPGSFRDPAGYIVSENGLFKRVINNSGQWAYRAYMHSGLHAELVADGLIVDHSEEDRSHTWPHDAATVIVPTQLPFISYPYEWSFSQLRDAALLTLQIQERALLHGLSLKDASAFNVQFHGSTPIFIDTLSFEPDPGTPWVAYEQFCRQFLAPLFLMHYGSANAAALLANFLDGLSLPWTAKLLPVSSLFHFGALCHIHLHSLSQRSRSSAPPSRSSLIPVPVRISLLHSLRRAVESLRPPPPTSHWSTYSQNRSHYSHVARASKIELVGSVLSGARPRLVYDLGANDGAFSLLAARAGSLCIAIDQDHACVDSLYRKARSSNGQTRILPLNMDLSNPSPSLGFAHEERLSFSARASADLTLALGLIHHLRISCNIPLASVARFFAQFSRNLLLEFVPPEDPMSQLMLHGRLPSPDHSLDGVLSAFRPHFDSPHILPIADSPRSLILFRAKS